MSRNKYKDIVERIRSAHVPDHRSGIFDVTVEERGGSVILAGQTTDREAAEELITAVRRTAGESLVDEIVRLSRSCTRR